MKAYAGYCQGSGVDQNVQWRPHY